jgi:hypothetical protein
MMGVEISALMGLVVLVAIAYAIVKFVQSAAPTGAKVLWIALIIPLRVIGLIVWILAGRRIRTDSLSTIRLLHISMTRSH